MTTDPADTAAEAALRAHHAVVAPTHLRTLLRQPNRISDMTLHTGDVAVDLTRARADAKTLDLLSDLAVERQVPQQLRAMSEGEPVNVTEDRPALHTALRLPAGSHLFVNGDDIVPDIERVYERISDFVDALHEGRWRGSTGEQIRSVVNIGIGGSDLGPRMVVQALRQYHVNHVDVHFVSNVDPADLDAVLAKLDPATTLFVIVSKTFTTVETLANAAVARRWLTDRLGPNAVAHHVVAVSAATEKAVEFGISKEAVFGFWDWVGGRFSLSSPVGLSIELAVGSTNMRDLRAGMHVVDVDLLTQPARHNAALMLGMLDVWYTRYFSVTSKAVIPYAQDLGLLPSHLQQLQMESNGKSVTRGGEPADGHTSPSVWGAPGTNGQHAFFQMLHQGTDLVPVDLIGVARSGTDERAHLLLANLVAQASALAIGRTADELRSDGVEDRLIPHRVIPGNRPSSLIVLPDLSPSSVGQLIAVYEHATVVAGLCWGINPFDQWGVELGKQVSNTLLPAIKGGDLPSGTDPATAATVARLQSSP